MDGQKYVLKTDKIYKSFGGNHVLKGIDFELKEGETDKNHIWSIESGSGRGHY